jgi:ribosomal protein L37AE/L43A
VIFGLFRRKPNAYEVYLDNTWKRYEEWRDSCHCLGCGKSILDRDSGEIWVTEECCTPCWKNGALTSSGTAPSTFN